MLTCFAKCNVILCCSSIRFKTNHLQVHASVQTGLAPQHWAIPHDGTTVGKSKRGALVGCSVVRGVSVKKPRPPQGTQGDVAAASPHGEQPKAGLRTEEVSEEMMSSLKELSKELGLLMAAGEPLPDRALPRPRRRWGARCRGR